MSSQRLVWAQDALAHLVAAQNSVTALHNDIGPNTPAEEYAIKELAAAASQSISGASTQMQQAVTALEAAEAPPPPPPPAPPPPPPPPPPKKIAMYGDSITHASQLFAKLPQAVVSNLAVAGTCLTDLIAPIVSQIPSLDADIVLCRYGVNDSNFNRDPNAFVSAIAAFVNTTRAAGKTPVLGSLTKWSGFFTGFTFDMITRWQFFNSLIAQSAANMGVNFIDITSVPATVMPWPGDTPDGLHPNAAYNDRVDTFIAQQLVAQGLVPA